MSSTGMAEAVRAASSRGQQASGESGAVVRMFGAPAGVAYTLDATEVARRRVVGLGPLDDRETLEALMGLPVGIPIPAGAVDGRALHRLRRVTPGAVEFLDGNLIRQAVPPVAVGLALVAARSGRPGLRKAGRFAPFSARALLLPSSSAEIVSVSLEAAFFGIGVCVFDAGRFRMLVEPEPYVRQRHTSAQWLFAEQVFRQVSGFAPVG